MFFLYQSNDFEVLKHIMFSVLKYKMNKGIFNNEFFLVQNKNLSFIIKIFLAKYLGICANFKFYLPTQFIWKIFKIFVPDIKDINYFSKFNLVFIIMKLLPDLIHLKEFILIKNYLKDDLNLEKLFFLSFKIADLYNQYLIYRVDWLHKWENSKLIEKLNNDIHQLWQSILWKKIIEYLLKKFNYSLNISNIYYKFLYLIKKKEVKISTLITNLFIFNVSFIPPIYFDVIYKLSKYIDIYYFLINPSSKFWFDKINFKVNNLSFTNYKNNKIKFNSLMLSYGNIFANYINLINRFNINEINFFTSIKKDTILHKVQNDILNFRNSYWYFKKKKKKVREKININDCSISINSCYGYLKEVEVLHDYLLNIILKFKYKPNDIIVLVSNINIYYPYIISVFSNSYYKKYLPFFIKKNKFKYYKENFLVFLKILDLSNLIITSSEILFFLNKKIIFKKLGINLDELEIINYIINNIGITDIINDNYVHYLSDDNSNWLYNIKRILLGYCIDNNLTSWEGIIPYNTIGNKFFNDLIGKLSQLIFKIFYWKKKLSKKYFIFDWILFSKNIILDFLDDDIVKVCPYFNINNWDNLLNAIEYSNFLKKVNSNLFIKIINKFFKVKKKVVNYSIGFINFCSFISFKGTSFKVYCLLGMNNNLFPRNFFPFDLDLIYFNFREGDKNKRDLDKFFFLECLCSTRDKFYISFNNYCFVKHKILYPSIVVQNLLDYLINNFFFNGIKYFKDKCEYVKHIFYLEYNNNILNNINVKENLLINYYSCHYEFFSRKLIKKKKKIIKKKLFKVKNIFFNNFKFFWFNPINFFFLKYLKINLYLNEKLFLKQNIFNTNWKEFYLARLELMSKFIFNNYINLNWVCYSYFSSFFSFKLIGRLIWLEEKEKFLKFLKNIEFNFINLKFYKFNILINKWDISGLLLFNKDNRLVKFLPKKLNLIDALIFFFDHLIYCYLGGNKNSYIYGYDNIWYYHILSKNDALFYLRYYLSGYLKGIKNPLFFLPQFSNYLILNFYKSKKSNYLFKIIKKKLYNILYGNLYFVGEVNNIYISFLRNNYNYNINLNFLINKAKLWLLPILNFLRKKK